MNPLRIGVDARELLGNATGVGRYLGELMRRWAIRRDADRRRFILYSPERLPFALPETIAESRVIGRGMGTWWEQTALGRAVSADRPDVFFAPAYTAPIGIDVPLAVTIHDISFIAHPEWFRPRERMRRRWLTRRAAATAKVIFTDSEFSRSELESRLAVDPARIRVVAPGVETLTSRDSGPATRRRIRARERLVLYVGTILNRRRLPDLIAAFALATADIPQARLTIVGQDRTWPAQDLAAIARDAGVAPKLEIRDYVSDAQLTDLYGRASVFAFLSEYEGFGLTPLEAVAAGVPAVVLDTAVAHEVYGDAVEYVGKADVAGTAAALRRHLLDPAAGRSLLARAPAVLARYSWDRAAEGTLADIERIAGR